MVNKIILLGNVGQDPEVKVINDNLKIATLKLATSESYTDKSGEKITTTQWHTCKCLSRLSDVIEKYVVKGMQLYVEGKMTYGSYEKDGITRYTSEVIISEIKMLGGNKKEQSAAPVTEQQAQVPTESDELPF